MNSNLDNWNYEIHLGRETEWSRYFGEYAWVVDLVFKNAQAREVTVISRPQLFLIRHTLELGYKANIIELEKVSGLTTSLKFHSKQAHSLKSLHTDFERHFLEIATKFDLPKQILAEYKELDKKATALKDLLHKFDQGSYAFRYPVATDGMTPHFDKNSTLNMSEVRKMYDSALVVLKYTTDVIAEHLSARQSNTNSS